MLDELGALESDVARFQATVDPDFVDPGRLAALIDRLQGTLSTVVHRARTRGEHLLNGHCSPTSWVMGTCNLAQEVAAERLRVGQQLEAMREVAEALSAGDIGYQSAAAICQMREKLGDKADLLNEREWIGYARQLPIKQLRTLTAHMRYILDPESFDKDTEEDYEQRFLHISEMNGMYQLSGAMDPVGGAALKTAIESLAKKLGADDVRTPKQRRADALTELVKHAMDEGMLPQRNGVRPHISVHTTLAGLKAELGAAASDLQDGTPISSKTVQRLACDGVLSRVLKADSIPVDVGRATRAVSAAQWRALKAKHKTCAGPGCDRPINWTSPHHIEFWAHGGPSDLPNLVPLCYYHHHLVHEGGWQVLKTGEGCSFIPPDRVIARRARGPGVSWAA